MFQYYLVIISIYFDGKDKYCDSCERNQKGFSSNINVIFIVFYHIIVFNIVIFHHLILFSKSILRNNSKIPKLVIRQKKKKNLFATENLKSQKFCLAT